MAEDTPQWHGTRKGYRERGCRCDRCRAWNSTQATAYTAMVRERDGVTPTQKSRPPKRRPCEECGHPTRGRAGMGADGLVLHKRCRDAREDRAYRDRRALVPTGVAPQEARRIAARDATRSAAACGLFTAGPCAWCAKPFISGGHRARYCSIKCQRKALAGRRSKGFAPSARLRVAIYERDAWTCQLCMEPVSTAAHYLDDWAPSLDHVVPQAHQLVPDHSAANLRTAHRWCNSVRGAAERDDFFEAVAV